MTRLMATYGIVTFWHVPSYVYIILETLCKTSMLMLVMNFCNILKCLCYLVLDLNLVNIIEFME